MLRPRRHHASSRRRHALPVVESLEGRALLALAATSVAVSVSSQVLSYGQAGTLSATVSALGGAAIPNSETVTFSSGGTTLGSAPLVNGLATLSTATFATGSYTITAAYGGDANFMPSTSNFDPASTQNVVPTNGLSDNLGLAVDGSGNVFITDSFNNRVVEVTPAGVQTTVVSTVTSPFGVAVDGSGDLFITADRSEVIEVSPSGTQTTLPFTGLSNPFGVAVDHAGNVFVADAGNGRVLELASGGTQTVVASGLDDPTGIAVDSRGDVFVTDDGAGDVVEVSPAGVQTTVVSGLQQPQGVAVDGAGDVFANESGANAQVIKVPPSGVATTLIPGSNRPHAGNVAPSGDLYFSDAASLQVVIVTPGVPLTILPDRTAIDLTASAAVLTHGQAGALTATVATANGATVPDGEIVRFSSGGTVLGTAPLVGGVASSLSAFVDSGRFAGDGQGDVRRRHQLRGEQLGGRAVQPARGGARDGVERHPGRRGRRRGQRPDRRHLQQPRCSGDTRRCPDDGGLRRHFPLRRGGGWVGRSLHHRGSQRGDRGEPVGQSDNFAVHGPR